MMVTLAAAMITATAVAARTPCSLTGQYVMGRKNNNKSRDNMTITQTGGAFTVGLPLLINSFYRCNVAC